MGTMVSAILAPQLTLVLKADVFDLLKELYTQGESQPSKSQMTCIIKLHFALKYVAKLCLLQHLLYTPCIIPLIIVPF